ncbi:hypothetical protein KAH43_00760, partial [Candidatus Bipolaricaulota bacterium]|nr:hypothetical protein [Candidatus Bipolaricaulota bacterium]
MWVIDRSNLIILGIAVGLVALLGLTLLFAPADQLEPGSPSHLDQGITSTPPAPVEPEPIVTV